MNEPSTERRAAISSREFELLEKVLTQRMDQHEKLDDTRFEAQEKVGAERYKAISATLEEIHKHYHNLNNKLTPIFALPERVDALVDDLKDVPRNKDLDHLSETFTSQITNLQQSLAADKAASDKRLARLLTVLGLILTFVFGLISVGSRFLEKKDQKATEERKEK